MNSTHYKLYFIFLFSFAHCALFGMHTLRLIQKQTERLSAHVFRPGHIHVFMNETKSIQVKPDIIKNVTLSTAGLTGCTAAVCHAKLDNGDQIAMLTHYHPAHHNEHLAELESQLSIWKKDMNSFSSLNFLSILPAEDYYQDQKSHLAICLERRMELCKTIQDVLPYPH